MLAVIGLATFTRPGLAQLSPGELSRAHAALDSSGGCLECHSAGRGVDPGRCLSCHGLLGERIAAAAGLHAGADHRRCETCHIEHYGREFELVWWGDRGESAFDHAEAGYPLAGAHRGLGCRECHQSSKIARPARLTAAGKDLDRTWLGLSTDCASCHEDPHAGQLGGRGCADCHGQQAWRPAADFDHDPTGFPLTGRHLGIACAGCHGAEAGIGGDRGQTVPVRFTGLQASCVGCHSDPHRGRLGRECATCHTTAGWDRVDTGRFAHDRTRFPLTGLHRDVACHRCHPPGKTLRVAGFESCATCHADVHAGQFRARDDGGACATCHDTKGFVPSRFTVRGHSATRFPLEGAHRAVLCAVCHRPALAGREAHGLAPAEVGGPAAAGVFRIDATGCGDCHRDPHGGTAGASAGAAGCRACHNQDDWKSVTFDHDATGFTLAGAHRPVSCGGCHPALVFARRSAGPAGCRDCHGDPHRGQLDRPGRPAACDSCHLVEGWTPTTFDHDRDAAFLLEGAHRRAACDACHVAETIDGRPTVRYRPLPTACSGCHRPGGTE
jgi:hypothetical protein